MKIRKSFTSPLRYPGGKSRLTNFLEDIILINNLEGCTLYELYAGGAGASLNLLIAGLCKKIVLNDLDFHLFAFWKSILEETNEFIKLIRDTEVNLGNWKIQQNIYRNHEYFSTLEVGFSTFFLNRSNRSGILYRAGPIGGFKQTGNYKIDARFNKSTLIQRINSIADLSNKIEIHNKESLLFLKDIFKRKNKQLLFLDPPYYKQGENLYLNFYQDKDHLALSNTLLANEKRNWVLTYDNCNRINELYKDSRRSYLPMTYSLQEKKKSKEVIVFSDKISLPLNLRIGQNSSKLELIS